MRVQLHLAIAVLLSIAATGCAVDNTIIKGQTRRGTVSSGTGGTGTTSGTTTTASTSSGTTSSSSTSSSSTTSSSTTSGTSVPCPILGRDDAGITLTDCPAGQVEVVGQISNYCQQGAPVTGGLAVNDILDPSLRIKADSCGIFHSCTDARTQIRVHIDSPSFAPTSLPVMLPLVSTIINQPVVLVCNQLTSGIEGQIAAISPYDFDGGALFLVMIPETGVFTRCSDMSGWQVAPTDRQGNLISGDVAYISTIGANPAATATSSIGVAVIYNLDPSVEYAQLQFTDTYADGGASSCVIESPTLPFTSSLPIEAGRFTDAIYSIY